MERLTEEELALTDVHGATERGVIALVCEVRMWRKLAADLAASSTGDGSVLDAIIAFLEGRAQ